MSSEEEPEPRVFREDPSKKAPFLLPPFRRPPPRDVPFASSETVVVVAEEDPSSPVSTPRALNPPPTVCVACPWASAHVVRYLSLIHI